MARILVVDDSALTRTLLVALLGRSGHEAESMEPRPPAQTWMAIRAFHPDLVVLDHLFPGCGYDGLHLIHHLRVFCPDLPVIVLTACQDPDVLGAYWEARASAVLPKPTGIYALARVVDAVADPRA